VGWRRVPAGRGARRNDRLRFRAPHGAGGSPANERGGKAGAKSPAPDARIGTRPEQQKQIEAIIASVQAQYKAIRQSAEPQVNEARQKGREQIRAILTPEQKPKFEEFLKRLDEERKRREQ